MSEKLKGSVVTIARLVVACAFIFSGFVKCVDPWGTAFKIDEYILALGVEWLDGFSLIFSVLLSGGELFLGLMLLFGLWKSIVSVVVLAFMVVMTLVTLWLAIMNPIDDCGCFGEAVKLTNWETFSKNVLLLAFSLIIWRNWSRKFKNIYKSKVRIFLIAIVSVLFPIISLLYLPIIDFLPYKVGVNLLEEFEIEGGEVSTVLVYRDKKNGDLKEFSLEDTEWYDDTRWEYVDTKVDMGGSDDVINEFALFVADTDVTDSVLSGKRVVLITLWNASEPISAKCAVKLRVLAEKKQREGFEIYCATPSSQEQFPAITLAGFTIKTLGIDDKVLRSCIRSEFGAMEIDNGIIISKKSCYNINY